MSNLLQRFLTGVIAGGVTVTLIVLSPWGAYAFCAVISLLGLHEFYQLTGLKKKRSSYIALGLGLLVWGFLLTYFFHLHKGILAFVEFVELNWAMVLMVGFGIVSLSVLFDKKEENALKTVGLTIMGFMMVFMPMVTFFMIGLSPWSRTEIGAVHPADSYLFQMPLGILFLHWGLDVFSYFGGRFLGKKLLFERISPKKTWAGSIIGGIFCLGIGVGLELIWPVHWNWIVAAAIVCVISQLGDLVESMYKRNVDIKDSGGLLPGHGGILDRFDGMFLSVPILYLYQFALFSLAY